MINLHVPPLTGKILLQLRYSACPYDVDTIASAIGSRAVHDVAKAVDSLAHQYNLISVKERHGKSWHVLTMSGMEVADLIERQPRNWESAVLLELCKAALPAVLNIGRLFDE